MRALAAVVRKPLHEDTKEWATILESPALLLDETDNIQAGDSHRITHIRDVRLIQVPGRVLLGHNGCPARLGETDHKRVPATPSASEAHHPLAESQRLSSPELDVMVEGNKQMRPLTCPSLHLVVTAIKFDLTSSTARIRPSSIIVSKRSHSVTNVFGGSNLCQVSMNALVSKE
jgi:hypothetical protein